MKKWLLFFTILLLAPNFLPYHLINIPASGPDAADFDSALAINIKSVDAMIEHVDSIAKVQKVSYGSENYLNLLSNTMFKRFFQGYSHYSMRENWIAAVCGRMIWYDLSAIVKADDIMGYTMAACSQQGIVLMEIFKRKHIPFRLAGFDHHFAVEAKLNDRWYYFDSNLNPDFGKDARPSFSALSKDNKVYKYYKNVIPRNNIDSIFGNPRTGMQNFVPGNKARIFQSITKFLSHWLWLAPLALYFEISRRKRLTWKSKKSSTSLTTG
jgi:hypothetical protein